MKTEQLTDFFLEKGYKIFFYTDEKKLRQVAVEEIIEDNYLFLHPNRFDRFADTLPDKVS